MRKPSLGQSRRHSLFEAVANVLFGFAISATANRLILPFYGMEAAWAPALELGVIFTFISLLRSYIFRRIFNHITVSSH